MAGPGVGNVDGATEERSKLDITDGSAEADVACMPVKTEVIVTLGGPGGAGGSASVSARNWLWAPIRRHAAST